MKWTRIFKFLTAIALCALAIFLYAVLIEPGLLLVKNYPLKVPHWNASFDGLKVVVLSDIHVGSLHIGLDKVRKIVETANAQNPDLILLLGDFVTGHGGNCSIKPPEFEAAITGLKAKYGVYSVLGNHDWWYNGVEVRKTLEAAGITVLENSSVPVNIGGNTLWLSGLADQWTRKIDLKAALSSVPDGQPIILMMHNPDFFMSVPQRVSLSLAGHTHGGQVSIPFVGPLVLPSKHKSLFSRGVITEGGRHHFVSSGIGTSIFPIRFCVPPEISVLEISAQ